jgi:hypothetical protein
MTDELAQPDQHHTSPFDTIRHTTDDNSEYWSTRELGKLLGYKTNYRNFQKAIFAAQL